MSKPVFVIAEQRDGAFRKPTYEVVSEGRRLADKLGAQLIAILLGDSVESIAAELGHYGADKVVVAQSGLFNNYSAEGYTQVISKAVQDAGAGIVLLTASALGKDLGPRLAAKLDTGLANDCIGLSLDGEKLICRRPMFAGKVIADVEFEDGIQIASLRPNIFAPTAPDTSKTAAIENVAVAIEATDVKALVKEVVASAGAKMDLTEADIIVSGGRGMKGPENYAIIEELATVLSGVVGASRAAVDAGWRPHADQVGQTGKTVSPKLYIACGISGAIQHLAGMSSSKCIVAINKDKEAPIFEKADYGIVGDLFDVVPALTAELKKNM
ncbi:electron transfer flavoprotein subunit alpha/FixB family protein [candidate division KSB1 bacterium]|nr:electron transfer flavoprotein subunit alpha/FixB family protein [candidate division KSB1 bacterium]